jgi:hypothetical protein
VLRRTLAFLKREPTPNLTTSGSFFSARAFFSVSEGIFKRCSGTVVCKVSREDLAFLWVSKLHLYEGYHVCCLLRKGYGRGTRCPRETVTSYFVKIDFFFFGNCTFSLYKCYGWVLPIYNAIEISTIGAKMAEIQVFFFAEFDHFWETNYLLQFLADTVYVQMQAGDIDTLV